MNSEKILSICIPTYNRGTLLKKTLENYINCTSFNEIEIVISDNCSTDDTVEIVKSYTDKYPNIKYQKLEQNIGADRNITNALSMGSGKYLKLQNDNVYIKDDMLTKIISILGKNISSKPNILFYQNNQFHSNETIVCKNINELVSEASYWITWIANFGIWRAEFENLEDKNRCADLRFNQVDWTLRMMDKKTETIIHFDNFYYANEAKHKGGYNLFHTFSVDYLSIYDEYLNAGKLDKKIFEKEKYRLMRYFFYGWLYSLNFVNVNYNFGVEDALSILKNTYGKYLYFYIIVLFVYFKGILRRLIKK
jgi:glycosyltransferase involved in cell wall biosynthesis